MICLAVTYTVKPGEEERAVECLNNLSAATRQEAGNIMYLTHRSPTNPRQFFLYEQYTDQDAFDAHRRQPHFIRYAIDILYTLIESRVVEIYAPLEPDTGGDQPPQHSAQ
jgi:quinol monooxygenase YgiN